MLEQIILEYGGFSLDRGRCHVVFNRSSVEVLVGEPLDNPGTSITSAAEEIGFSLRTSVDLDVTRGHLFHYTPWDAAVRRERTVKIEFRGDAWSMPVWTDLAAPSHFVSAALEQVHHIRPYALTEMQYLELVKSVIRVRIDAIELSNAHEKLDAIGRVAHISQRRFFYVDVRARSDAAAVAFVIERLDGRLSPDRVQVTTANAPLDQPGTLAL